MNLLSHLVQIRLAAAEAVRVCVDDFDFVVEDFSPVRA